MKILKDDSKQSTDTLPKMMTPREEIKEAFRLSDLHNLAVLDTPAEPEFDALVTMASELLNCPFSTLSLVDSTRQWFKAKVGVSVCETPKDISICQHAVKVDKPLILDDLLMDTRVNNSPLVTSAPYLRSYLGIPIKGLNKALIGTLCVFDTSPRKWKDQEVKMLTNLTVIAEQLLHKHHNTRRPTLRSASGAPISNTKDNICGIWWISSDSSYVTMSASLRTLLGISSKTKIDKNWFSNFATNRAQVFEKLKNEDNSKQITQYDLYHPSGYLLEIEESIYHLKINQSFQFCGQIRLLGDDTNQLPTLLTTFNISNTELLSSKNVIEAFASKKTGFFRIDQNNLAYVLDHEGGTWNHSLPIPWETCFLPGDRTLIHNEIVAARLDLHTKTLFVRNSTNDAEGSWLKLELMGRSHGSPDDLEVIVKFTRLLEF